MATVCMCNMEPEQESQSDRATLARIGALEEQLDFLAKVLVSLSESVVWKVSRQDTASSEQS